MKKKKPREDLKNINSRSLMVRFNVFFYVFSVIPLGVLSYFFYQYLNSKTIELTDGQALFLIMLVGLGCIIGFFGVRNSLIKLVVLSTKLKESLFGEMDREAILALAKEEGEVAELAKAFGDLMNRLEDNITELRETKKTLHSALSKVGKTLASVENFDLLIQLTLETTVEALSALRGAIYSFSEENSSLIVKSLVGINRKDISEKVNLGEGTLGWVAKERKPLFVPLLEEGSEENSLFSPPLICTPLVSRDKLWGVIILSGRKAGDNFSEDELKILSNLASQMAVSLENTKLSTDIERTYFETISALALAVEAKDPYSRGHSERVAAFSVRIAEKWNFSNEQIKILRDACKLHDIGKIGILDDVLQKPGKLSYEELKIMEKHPLVGESIVKPLKSLKALLDPIRHHHEKLDGSGYPDSLKNDEISLTTRILTVADIFDAVISDRPYRKALSYEDAIRELEELVNEGKIDGQVVDCLKEIL